MGGEGAPGFPDRRREDGFVDYHFVVVGVSGKEYAEVAGVVEAGGDGQESRRRCGGWEICAAEEDVYAAQMDRFRHRKLGAWIIGVYG